MSKKIIISLLATFVLFLAMPARAEEFVSQFPQLNPYCWHRIDCHNARKQFLINPPSCTAGDPTCKELEQGFITGASVAPCAGISASGTVAEEWGRCLPAGTTKTEISFGGQDRFSNIGEFIVVMYKYLLTIASIVAVVVIIIAGMQWVTSGGNSEAISSAKKRIGGAIIGLFIAYSSYFVLNTINPALVNLRLPQVWMQNKIILPPLLCEGIAGAKEGTLRFLHGASGTDSDQARPLTIETADYKANGYVWTIPKNPEMFACGMRLFPENGGEMTCVGTGGCEQAKRCWDWEKGTEYGLANGRHTGKWKCKSGEEIPFGEWDAEMTLANDLACLKIGGSEYNPLCYLGKGAYGVIDSVGGWLGL